MKQRHFSDIFLKGLSFEFAFPESTRSNADNTYQPWIGLFWWPFLDLKIRNLWPEVEPGVVMNDLAAEDNELFLCFLSSVFACVAVLQPDKSLPMRCAGGFCRWASRVWSSANQFWAFILSCYLLLLNTHSHWFCLVYSVILETFFLVFCHRKKDTSTQTIIMVLSSSHHQDDHHLNLANNWKIRGIWTP